MAVVCCFSSVGLWVVFVAAVTVFLFAIYLYLVTIWLILFSYDVLGWLLCCFCLYVLCGIGMFLLVDVTWTLISDWMLFGLVGLVLYCVYGMFWLLILLGYLCFCFRLFDDFSFALELLVFWLACCFDVNLVFLLWVGCFVLPCICDSIRLRTWVRVVLLSFSWVCCWCFGLGGFVILVLVYWSVGIIRYFVVDLFLGI